MIETTSSAARPCPKCQGRRYIRRTATVRRGGEPIQEIQYDEECPDCTAGRIVLIEVAR